MFQPLRLWQKFVARGDAAEAERSSGRERRIDTRHDCTGRDARLRLGSTQYRMHLKDLSCSGASGLTDAPLRVGQSVYLEIDRENRTWAEVRWTRRAWVGLLFDEAIGEDIVRKLRLRYPKARYRAPARRGGREKA